MNIIKFVRIFLLVLIVIGTGLLITQKMWVPKMVSIIMKDDSNEQIPEVSNNKNLQSDSSSSSIKLPLSQKEGCLLKPYTGTMPLSDSEYYSPGYEDLRGGVFCNFIINSKLPMFTFHFVGQEDNTLGKIDISEGNSGKIIQTIDNTMSYNMTLTRSQNTLKPVDINFDGYLDLPILKDCGATGNCSYDIYLYTPATNQFVKNPFLSNLGGFKPEGIDSVKKQITTSWNRGYADWEEDIFQYQSGQYILIQRNISRSNQEQDQTITNEVYKLENGVMKLVNSTTTPSN